VENQVQSECSSWRGSLDIEDIVKNSKLDTNEICGVHKVELCCCGQSKEYPLCDKTHEIFNKETNSNIQPLIVRVEEEVEKKDSSTKENVNTESEVIVKRKSKNSFCAETRKSMVAEEDNTVVEQPNIIEENKPNEENSKKEENPKKEEVKKLPKPVNRKSITAIFTKEDVEKHCTKEDCWMIVKGNVYDVTTYFDFHPGGHQALMNFAGKDGTENVEFHSSKMMFLLDKYFYIGKLKKEPGSGGFCIIS